MSHWQALPLDKARFRSDAPRSMSAGVPWSETFLYSWPLERPAAFVELGPPQDFSWLRPQLYAVLPDSVHLVSVGHWDGTIRVTNTVTGHGRQAIETPESSVCTAVCVAVTPPAAVAMGAVGLIMSTPKPATFFGGSGAGGAASKPVMVPSEKLTFADGPHSAAILAAISSASVSESLPGISGALAPDTVASVYGSAGLPAVLVIGDMDGRLRFFDVKGGTVDPSPRAEVLHHEGPVTCVQACPSADVAVSASLDGTVNVYSLQSATLRFSLRPNTECLTARRSGSIDVAGPGEGSTSTATASSTGPASSVPDAITWAGIASSQVILAYAAGSRTLHSYSLNGALLTEPVQLPFDATAFAWSLDGYHIVIAGAHGLVEIREACTLEVEYVIGAPGTDLRRICDVMHEGDMDSVGDLYADICESTERFPAPVTSISFTEHEQALMLGLSNGELRIFTLDESFLTRKILDRFETALGF